MVCAPKSGYPHLATQGVDDPQHLRKPYGGLTSLQINDEAHTHASGQGQIRLGELQVLAGGAECRAQGLGSIDVNHARGQP